MDTLSKISALTKDLLYYSESEHPFSVEQWELTSLEELPAKIASLTQTDPSQQRVIAHADFFHKMTRIVDPNDKPMIVNAQKARELYQYLQEEFKTIQVIRVEGNSVTPIFITGMLPGGNCVVLRTTAIET